MCEKINVKKIRPLYFQVFWTEIGLTKTILGYKIPVKFSSLKSQNSLMIRKK